MSIWLFIKNRAACRLAPLTLILAGAVGCGTGKSFTHDGDPLLGNFNRPITPTPPPTGADIDHVWDGGPGINPAPAIGNNQVPYIPGQLAPLPGTSAPTGGAVSSYSLPGQHSTNAALAGGPRGAKATINEYLSSDQSTPAQVPTRVGASIPLGNRFEQASQPPVAETKPDPKEPTAPLPDPNSVQIRQPQAMATSRGSAIVPDSPPLPQQGPTGPLTVKSVEEGQHLLTLYGVKWQRMEKVENGDWQFTCAVSNPNSTTARQYSARHTDQLQALKAVVEQVQLDR